MTWRAVMLGLIAAVFISTVGYMNRHIGISELTRGHLPISVFGLLIVVVAVVNPLLYTLSRRMRFRPAELAVMVLMALVACNIPGAGMMRYFTINTVTPIQLNQLNDGWQKNDAFSYAPAAMFVADGQYHKTAVGGYLGGLGKPGQPIGLGQVPWAQWRGPLVTWLPLILLCSVAVICMSVIVHPQWSKRERLKYPIADFASSLLQQEPGRAAGPIFRSKAFWGALLAILCIHLVNGLYAWYPDRAIQIPLRSDFTAIFRDKFPTFMATPWANYLTTPEIFPTVVAFSFFLASDIGFTLGISNLLNVVAMFLMLRAGLEVSGTYMTGGLIEWHNFGSYLGVAAMLGYIGRRYYWRVLRGALTFRRQRETERYAVVACRVFLLASAAMVVLLTRLGLDWILAVLAVLVLMLMFLVMARISAETGVFYYKPPWLMPGILVGLFGAEAIGPTGMAVLGMSATILAIDPFECLIPYVVNGLKITDDAGVRPGRAGLGATLAFTLALAAAVPAVLWADYNFGVPQTQWQWQSFGAKHTFDGVSKTVSKLEMAGEGKLEEVEAYGAWDRLTHMTPDRRCLWAIVLGFALVLLCGKMRLRFAWWPLHPVVFLTFGASRLLGKFGFSFLLGWFIKVALTRIGGRQKYRGARPLMVGVIAGDLLGGLVFMAVNWVYYLVMARAGVNYRLW